MAIDLHTHTIYSDGGLSPTELVKKAKEIGLSALAIADHDSVSGIGEALEAGKKLGVEVVPAIEISAYPNQESEYHLLGYFIDWRNASLNSTLKHFQEGRHERAVKVVERLNELGYQVDFDSVQKLASNTIVQPHIAFAVIEHPANREKLTQEFGSLPRTGDFIREHLIPGKDAYVARETLTPRQAIELIHSVGGLAVVAHPVWNLVKKVDGSLVFDDQALVDLIKLGLDGIEAYSHRENEADTRVCTEHYLQLAQKLNLVVSGGSDFHGFGSAGKKLGFQDFYLKVPGQVLLDLKARLK